MSTKFAACRLPTWPPATYLIPGFRTSTKLAVCRLKTGPPATYLIPGFLTSSIFATCRLPTCPPATYLILVFLTSTNCLETTWRLPNCHGWQLPTLLPDVYIKYNCLPGLSLPNWIPDLYPNVYLGGQSLLGFLASTWSNCLPGLSSPTWLLSTCPPGWLPAVYLPVFLVDHCLIGFLPSNYLSPEWTYPPVLGSCRLPTEPPGSFQLGFLTPTNPAF